MRTQMTASARGGGPNFGPITHPGRPIGPGKDAPLALVIEDDESAADIAATMLNVLGYCTRIAVDGHAALYALAEEPPDLILLDIHLPEMDGVTLLRVARRVAETRETPVVACSAIYPASGPVARVLKELGAERYLSKPFNLAGLREAVIATHPGSPASRAGKPAARPSRPGAPSPMFRVDEVVAKVVSEAGETMASVQAVSEQRVILRFSEEPPEPGASVRLEVHHRVAVDDSMTDVAVRVLGAVGLRRKDGRSWIVELDVRAAAPAGGLERLRKHL